ncbi:hypothetical protein [Xenorhabdus bovienii]|uniref:hypothetical protein n=1 Tax=Xenorhabdus bovienii TaxID=40576 RepID=UPI0023B33797|nr:hypothetical protein [Xenorhabdus bovienii]MDE9467550.1 hypothetical protein [Xenorhabdus bovienii]
MKFSLTGISNINEVENQKTSISVALHGEDSSYHSLNLVLDKCECDVRNMSFNEIEYLAIQYLKNTLNDAHCHHHHHG